MFQPREFFEDDNPSADVDLDRQDAAPAAWARDVTGIKVDAASIRSLLAEDRVEVPVDVFVEEAVAHLLESSDSLARGWMMIWSRSVTV